MRIATPCFVLAVLLGPVPASAQTWATSGEGLKCVPLRRADSAALWIKYGERRTGVEGSLASAEKRGDKEWNHLFFGVEFGADRPISTCMRVRWRVEPWGPHPIDAADFGGTFPSGVMDLIDGSDHGETSGAIQIWVPDDSVRERPETFRIVLLDAVTRTPLAGTVGVYDVETGMRARNPDPRALDMRGRMVMTVEDAPEQAARR